MESISTVVFVYKGKTYHRDTYNGIACVYDSDGFFNITQVLKDNGRNDIDQIKKTNYWTTFEKAYIAEANPNNDPSFVLSYVIKNPRIPKENEWILGTYYRKPFLNYICVHVDGEYALKVSKIMDLIDERIKLKVCKLEEELFSMEFENMEYEQRIKNINSGFNREEPGAILIKDISSKRSGEVYKIDIRPVSVLASDWKGYTIINDVYNAEDILRLVNYYTQKLKVYGIESLGRNEFRCPERKLIKLIDEIMHNRFNAEYDIEEYTKRYLNNNKDVQESIVLNHIFEFFCAYKYDLGIYKLEPVERIGLSKQDRGIDLIDVDKHVIAQCKYYKSARLELIKLRTFIDFCRKYKQWTRIVYVSEDAVLSEGVEAYADEHLFDVVRVPEKEFQNTFV